MVVFLRKCSIIYVWKNMTVRFWNNIFKTGNKNLILYHLALSEWQEFRAFELLRSGSDRAEYLLIKEAKIIAMTCTHAALKRRDLVSVGFKVMPPPPYIFGKAIHMCDRNMHAKSSCIEKQESVYNISTTKIFYIRNKHLAVSTCHEYFLYFWVSSYK